MAVRCVVSSPGKSLRCERDMGHEGDHRWGGVTWPQRFHTRFRVWNANATEDIGCLSAERAVGIFMGLHPDERGNAVEVKPIEKGMV